MNYDFGGLTEILAQIDDTSADALVAAIQAHSRIFVYGAGRSGLMIKAFAMRLAQAGYTVFAVGDVTTPAIKCGDLLLLASASGETASVLRYARIAKDVGACVLSLTARESSTLASLSQRILLLHAPTKDDPTSGAVMGTLFEQAVLLFCDAAVERLGVSATDMRARHANLE